MTRKNLTCIHEPFGDAFYFGPERLGTRYENDEKARQESGFADSTYQTILDRIDHESEEVCAADFFDCQSFDVVLFGARFCCGLGDDWFAIGNTFQCACCKII
jgi:hypothetical protein